MKDLKYFEGKHIYVKLFSNRVYSGVCDEVTFLGKDEQGIDTFLFSMTDKFGSWISFSNKEIKFIEEEK